MSTEEAQKSEGDADIENLEEHIQASKIITKYLPWSAGAGLVPLPGLDLAGITAIHIKMVADISQVYGVPFKQEAAKNIISSLLLAVIPSGMAQQTAEHLVPIDRTYGCAKLWVLLVSDLLLVQD